MKAAAVPRAPVPRAPASPAGGWAVFLVFAAALLPRLWALDWAFPLKTGHIDEGVVVFYSLRAAAGELDPGAFFDYPGFFLYALAALFKASLLAARLWGHAVPPASEALAVYTRGDGLMFLLAAARALSAVLGAATAAALFRMGAGRWGSFAGLSAALLWAVNPLAVRHAHYATVDTAAAFLTLLAVDKLTAYWQDGRRRDGLWAALLIGLSAATKYYPGILALFLLPAPFFSGARKPGRTAFLLAGATGLSFLAASPYVLLAAPAFAARFAHLFPKIVGWGESGGGNLFGTLKGLVSNGGAAACAAGAAGMGLLLKSPGRGDRVLAAVFFFLLLFFGSWAFQSPHYALPLYPLLFLAAGRALSAAGRLQRALPAGLLALLLTLSLPGAARSLRLFSTMDTRLGALAWVREAVPSGSRILRFAHTPEFSPRDPFHVTVDWENKRLDKGAAALASGDFDFLLYASYAPAADPVLPGLSSRFRLLKLFNDPAPSFPHDPAVYIFSAREGAP